MPNETVTERETVQKWNNTSIRRKKGKVSAIRSIIHEHDLIDGKEVGVTLMNDERKKPESLMPCLKPHDDDVVSQLNHSPSYVIDGKSSVVQQPFSMNMVMPFLPMMPVMATAVPPIVSDTNLKRKRGRPSNKEKMFKNIKDSSSQGLPLPVWGYSLTLPLSRKLAELKQQQICLTGSKETSILEGKNHIKEQENKLADITKNKTLNGKPIGKSKGKPSGKPRGRPRSTSRRDEVPWRSKPAIIAPAHFVPNMASMNMYGFLTPPASTTTEHLTTKGKKTLITSWSSA